LRLNIDWGVVLFAAKAILSQVSNFAGVFVTKLVY